MSTGTETNTKIDINGHKFEKFIVEGLKRAGFKFSNNDLVVVSPNDLKLRLDFQPYVLWESFVKKDYEFYYNDMDAIFIDIGMNAGFVSLQFAQKENIKMVYSFEPFIPTYEGALENISLNKELAKKIKTFPFGLSNKNEKAEVLYEKELAGNMSLVKDLYTNSTNPGYDITKTNIEIVEIRDTSEVLQNILESNKDKKIILKCDTEGSEFNIIESLDNSGLLPQIDIILMEYHFNSPKIIEETLVKNNFIVFYKGGYNPNVTCSTLYAVHNERK